MSKVAFTILVSLSLLILSCERSEEEPTSFATPPGGTVEEGVFAGTTALETPVSLIFGGLVGSTHAFPTYLIERFVGFEAVGIDAEVVIFGNGPIMVESVSSGGWDAGAYGLGGTYAGTIGHGVINVGAPTRDFHALMFFADPESEIVQAGRVTPGHPELYGTADTWRDQEIFLPIGTTLHYTLMLGLEALGLTADDIVMTHMDVPNINTAMRAGRVEVGGLWSNFPYNTEINERFTPVIQSSDVGVVLTTVMAVNPVSYDDPVKYQGIQKWVELYFTVVDWIYASNENYNQAVDMFIEWNEEQGIRSVRNEIESHLTFQRPYTLEENYRMFTEMNDTRTMLQVEEYQIAPLEFFIENGNYTEADKEILLSGYFRSDMLEAIYNERRN